MQDILKMGGEIWIYTIHEIIFYINFKLPGCDGGTAVMRENVLVLQR